MSKLKGDTQDNEENEENLFIYGSNEKSIDIHFNLKIHIGRVCSHVNMRGRLAIHLGNQEKS